jgi:hypothetical protein
MKRLSQRGWGLFKIQDIDLDKGTASVKLEHSAFVYVYGKVGRKVDYMFTGWFAGAMDQIRCPRQQDPHRGRTGLRRLRRRPRRWPVHRQAVVSRG